MPPKKTPEKGPPAPTEKGPHAPPEKGPLQAPQSSDDEGEDVISVQLLRDNQERTDQKLDTLIGLMTQMALSIASVVPAPAPSVPLVAHGAPLPVVQPLVVDAAALAGPPTNNATIPETHGYTYIGKLYKRNQWCRVVRGPRGGLSYFPTENVNINGINTFTYGAKKSLTNANDIALIQYVAW
jgi:hypothetical protein